MDWRFNSNFLLLLVATALSTRLAYYAWKRRPATGSTLFTLLTLAMAQWSLAYTLEITSTELATKLVWTQFQYLGVVILPVAWLIFTLEYTGKESWITRRNVILLAIIPTSTFLLVMTNEAHGWVWRQVNLVTSDSGLPVLVFDYGFWFWVHTAFSYACLFVASTTLLVSWRRQPASLYRWQTVALLFGLLLPWVGNALLITGISPQALSTFTFLLSGVTLVHFTLRYRLFDIAPVAHRAIFDSMNVPILVLDRENRIADANPAAQQVTQKALTELIGADFETIWPGVIDGPPTETEGSFEIELGSPEATTYFEVSVSPLHDWRQVPRGHLMVMHDITRRKSLERVRDNMTEYMVHNLRDPLSNSLFALQMLKGDLSEINSPESAQLLDLSFGQTMKTLNLVDEILEISHLQHDIEIPIIQTTFSLAELIEKVTRHHAPQAQEQQLDLYYDLPESLPPAWADANLIERVLRNLIENSIKFSPLGGKVRVAVNLIAPTSSPETKRLQISVSDEGPSIPRDAQESIFEQSMPGKNRLRGRGLGLAFCRMAMMAHGEKIWVESRPERGSKFIFSLPIAHEQAASRVA